MVPKKTGLGNGYLEALKSDKFQLFAYYPEVEEWISFAEQNGYHPDTVAFAKVYPEFYELIGYMIYTVFERSFYSDAQNNHDVLYVKSFISRLRNLSSENRITMAINLLEKVLIPFLELNKIPYSNDDYPEDKQHQERIPVLRYEAEHKHERIPVKIIVTMKEGAKTIHIDSPDNTKK